MKKISFILFAIIISFVGCSKDDRKNGNIPDKTEKNLTIFFINDPHGQLDNFSKIKHILDKEKEETNVIVACSGDIFSGNPVVDNYPEKGYPMIDIMNKTGFDISVIGNHEYDYGDSYLKKRIEQSDFNWICANVDMGSTDIPEPYEYYTITVDSLKVTFLGLVETGGKENLTIPSTHPLRVQDISFERPEDVVSQYPDIKDQEDSDLYIALSHLGHNSNYGNLGDYQLAVLYPYFDLIIGGHSHRKIDTVINNIPIFQSGSYLNYLGKIELLIKDEKIDSISFDLIDLSTYTEYDSELKAVIDEYNDLPYLKEVVGFSNIHHDISMVGCFYADALKEIMNVDVSFQNTGGVRTGLDEGDITKREIFELAPFNNGTVIYNMSTAEIKTFLKESGSGFYYSGIQIEQIGENIQFKDLNGNIIEDNTILSLGINDYIPAVHDTYFPANGNTQSLTTTETIIFYLVNINSQVNYPDCDNYFRYQ